MARLFSNRERPFDLGMLPTELLERNAAEPVVASRLPGDANPAGADSILAAAYAAAESPLKARQRKERKWSP